MVKYLQKIFKSNNNAEIENIYNLYRDPFVQYIGRRFNLDKETIFDIYQDTFISFYENVQNKKVNKLTCSVKTYVFSIGIRQVYKYLEKKKPLNQIEIYDNILYDNRSTEWNEMQEIVYETVKNMPDPCNTVLNLFYWKHNSMKEIATKMKYKNEVVARNRKSLCLKTLKDQIKEKIKRLI